MMHDVHPALYEAATSRLSAAAGVTGITATPRTDRRGGNYMAALIHLDAGEGLKILLDVDDTQATADDRYLLTAWQHRRGNLWDVAATSFRIFGRYLRLDELPLAFEAVLYRAQHHPISRQESTALLGRPWYVTALKSLQERSEW
ncbi:hypothetical protein [Nonomuraea sp. NPDC023979]|uniref:hypothetical protein n=1 Tax=Nonomuraea sp. NPDC023979 TaxID=3154796 RepID=UPI0033DA7175